MMQDLGGKSPSVCMDFRAGRQKESFDVITLHLGENRMKDDNYFMYVSDE